MTITTIKSFALIKIIPREINAIIIMNRTVARSVPVRLMCTCEFCYNSADMKLYCVTYHSEFVYNNFKQFLHSLKQGSIQQQQIINMYSLAFSIVPTELDAAVTADDDVDDEEDPDV